MVYSVEGKYNSQAHLVEIIALLGPPPKKLIDWERERRIWKWRNTEGKFCDSASIYYRGPFSDSRGKTKEKSSDAANL
jgi:hypothetical protein